MNQLLPLYVSICLIFGASAAGQTPKSIEFTQRDGFHSITIPITRLSLDKLDERKLEISSLTDLGHCGYIHRARKKLMRALAARTGAEDEPGAVSGASGT